MIALAGTYQNGVLKLDKEYTTNEPVKVIVTFLEKKMKDAKPERRLKYEDFSFEESQKDLAHYIFSFSDAVIAERRGDEL